MAKKQRTPEVQKRIEERIAFVQAHPDLSKAEARKQFYVQTRTKELEAKGVEADTSALRRKFETGGVTREGFYTESDIQAAMARRARAESNSQVSIPRAPVVPSRPSGARPVQSSPGSPPSAHVAPPGSANAGTQANPPLLRRNSPNTYTTKMGKTYTKQDWVTDTLVKATDQVDYYVTGTAKEFDRQFLQPMARTFTNPLINTVGGWVGKKPNLETAGPVEAAVTTAFTIADIYSFGSASGLVRPIGETVVGAAAKRWGARTVAKVPGKKIISKVASRAATQVDRAILETRLAPVRFMGEAPAGEALTVRAATKAAVEDVGAAARSTARTAKNNVASAVGRRIAGPPEVVPSTRVPRTEGGNWAGALRPSASGAPPVPGGATPTGTVTGGGTWLSADDAAAAGLEQYPDKFLPKFQELLGGGTDPEVAANRALHLASDGRLGAMDRPPTTGGAASGAASRPATPPPGASTPTPPSTPAATGDLFGTPPRPSTEALDEWGKLNLGTEPTTTPTSPAPTAAPQVVETGAESAETLAARKRLSQLERDLADLQKDEWASGDDVAGVADMIESEARSLRKKLGIPEPAAPNIKATVYKRRVQPEPTPKVRRARPKTRVAAKPVTPFGESVKMGEAASASAQVPPAPSAPARAPEPGTARGPVSQPSLEGIDPNVVEAARRGREARRAGGAGGAGKGGRSSRKPLEPELRTRLETADTQRSALQSTLEETGGGATPEYRQQARTLSKELSDIDSQLTRAVSARKRAASRMNVNEPGAQEDLQAAINEVKRLTDAKAAKQAELGALNERTTGVTAATQEERMNYRPTVGGETASSVTPLDVQIEVGPDDAMEFFVRDPDKTRAWLNEQVDPADLIPLKPGVDKFGETVERYVTKYKYKVGTKGNAARNARDLDWLNTQRVKGGQTPIEIKPKERTARNRNLPKALTKEEYDMRVETNTPLTGAVKQPKPKKTATPKPEARSTQRRWKRVDAPRRPDLGRS